MVVKCVCGFTLLQAVAVEVTAPFLAISSSNERAYQHNSSTLVLVLRK